MPNVSRRALLAGAGAPPLAAPARAQAFPERSVRIIVPFNPGGVTDVLARATAAALQPVLGQPVVVENRAGANGTVGSVAAARSPADGHTMVMGTTDTHSINASTFRNVQYSPETDFMPVSMVATVPFGLMVGPTRMRTVGDFTAFVEEAKRDGERLTFGTRGVGSTSHLAYTVVSRARGFESLHVPFTGQAPAMQAVAAGQVDAMVLPIGAAHALDNDGRTRALAVAAPRRLDLVPDAPTFTELGVDLRAGLWNALFLPRGTPERLQARLNEALGRAFRSPQFVEALRQQSAVPELMPPAQLAEHVRDEVRRWRAVVQAANIRVD